MLDDEVSSSLISSYHKFQELHSSVDTKEVLEKLHNAKLEMDNNINVINYRKAYKDYQILIGKVTDVGFEGISSSSTIDKIIRKTDKIIIIFIIVSFFLRNLIAFSITYTSGQYF